MQLTELLSLLVGGGILWKFLPLLTRYTAEAGPILEPSRKKLTMVQGEPNRVYPRVLEIENIGDRAALQTTWEIRHYYATFPPDFYSVHGSQMIALKPQEHFLLSVEKDGSEPDIPGLLDLSVAHFGSYEIMLWYEGPNHVKYLSHLSIWLGDLKQHRVGLTPLSESVLLSSAPDVDSTLPGCCANQIHFVAEAAFVLIIQMGCTEDNALKGAYGAPSERDCEGKTLKGSCVLRRARVPKTSRCVSGFYR
jgi:hypothetical protein